MTFLDSPWALTALTQAQFWDRRDFARDYGDGTAVDSPVGRHLRLGHAGDALRQAGQAVHARGDREGGVGADQAPPHAPATSCPTTSCTRGSWTRGSRGSRAGSANRNDTPLLVNTVGTWDKRPQAHTKVPNLFLAGDYVQTDVDLATMEGGNESGRAAVAALLHAAGSSAEPPQMYKLYEPPELAAVKQVDAERYKAGQPNAARRRVTGRSSASTRSSSARAAPGRRPRSALARAGRRVVALDRVAFPADTISTHLLWPGGVAELQALGALERVRALGAPPLPLALAGAGELAIRGDYTPVDGIDHALCVRRPGLDAALVATAREAGAEVRERARVTELVRDGGRVAGVRYATPTGGEHELRAPLVVGADGRRSTVARLAGAQRPLPRAPERARLLLRLLGGRAARLAQHRRAVARGRGARHRVPVRRRPAARAAAAARGAGGRVPRGPRRRVRADRRRDPRPGRAPARAADQATKVRSATGIASYFRRSSGPGWALAGDAGHFKDPVTAQGIRDALRYGRRLGEAAAPVLEDAARARPRAARLGARARARLPRGLPVDEPARPRRAAVAAGGRALPRGRRRTRCWPAAWPTSSRAARARPTSSPRPAPRCSRHARCAGAAATAPRRSPARRATSPPPWATGASAGLPAQGPQRVDDHRQIDDLLDERAA